MKLRIPMPRIKGIVRNAIGWSSEEDRAVARTMSAAHSWLEDQHGSTTPFFLWVDTFDPHEPWDQPRYYTDLYDPGYEGDELMEPAYEPADYATEREIEHMRCMYAGKLTMVDRWIGCLLDGIEFMGLNENTAVIVTSDHGFYHGEHNLIGKVRLDRDGVICGRWPLYDTIAHPPLLVRGPDLPRRQRLSSFCQPPDLTATILDLAGVPAPGTVQGHSLLPLLRGEQTCIRDCAISSLNYTQDDDVRAPTSLRTDDWLYIYGGDEWDDELYDLAQDPGETTNVIDAQPEAARAIHARYLEVLEAIDCPPNRLDGRREFRPIRQTNIPHRKII